MKVTHILHVLPILFQGFYAESQCSKAIIGTVETIKEMNQVFKSRGFYNQDDIPVLEFMIETYEDFMDQQITGLHDVGAVSSELTSEETTELVHKIFLCDGFSIFDPHVINSDVIHVENRFREIWDAIKFFKLLDLEETKNLISENNKVFTAFLNFRHSILSLDQQSDLFRFLLDRSLYSYLHLQEQFGKIFGINTDIETRFETVYKTFEDWQGIYSSKDSAKILQLFLSKIIEELKPFAKAIDEFTFAAMQRVRTQMNRQRRSVPSDQVLAYQDYFEKIFMHEDVLEFIDDLLKISDHDLGVRLDYILESKNQRRFHDITNGIRIAVVQVKSYWTQIFPIETPEYYSNKFELENDLGKVQKVVASTEFKMLLVAVLKFPRAFCKEFDMEEFIQINKILWVEVYPEFTDFIERLAIRYGRDDEDVPVEDMEAIYQEMMRVDLESNYHNN